MRTLMRLRMTLPDTPGSLAKVASVIAEAGGNIVAVDVHQRGPLDDPDLAVDDLYVELPDEGAMWEVRGALSRSGCGTVIAYHLGHELPDPVTVLLRHACALVGARGSDADELLIRSVEAVCTGATVTVAPESPNDAGPSGRLAVESGAPVVRHGGMAPPGAGLRDARYGWSTLAIPRTGGAVVWVGRPATDPLTTTEAARAEAVVRLFDRLVEATQGQVAGRS
jgi:hypothetical protein